MHSSDHTSGEEVWADGSDGFNEDDSDDSENYSDMLAHENALTKRYWIPSDNHLFVLTLGD